MLIYSHFSKSFIIRWNSLFSNYYGFVNKSVFIKKKILHKTFYISPVILPYGYLNEKKIYFTNQILKKIDNKKSKPKTNDPVTYRILVKNIKIDDIKKKLSQNCRRAIKKSIIQNYIYYSDNEKKFIKELYYILLKNAHNHGSLFMPFDLFKKICMLENALIKLVKKDNKVLGGGLIIKDNGIYLIQYASILNLNIHNYANYFLYWNCILDCKKQNIDIFDLGRSPYNSKFHIFKFKFRPEILNLKYCSTHLNLRYDAKFIVISSFIIKMMPLCIYKILNRLFYKYIFF